MNPSPLVYVIYFDAASGHRSAAQHIAHALNEQGRMRAEIVNLTEITDLSPRFGWIVKKGIDYFNAAIRKDKLFDLGGLINLSLLFHDTLSQKSLHQLAAFWKDKEPAAVISVTPMYNPALKKSLDLYCSDVPYLCIPVDMDEKKARYWFTPKVAMSYLCATPALMERGRLVGVAEECLVPLSGMPARMDKNTPGLKEELFAEWGFRMDWPTCFVSFGGQGTVQVLRIAQEAEKQGIEANFLFFCGKNEGLYKALEKGNFNRPKKLFQYLSHAPTAYLGVADLVLGKPGAMTLAEAQLAGVPLFALKSTGLKLVQKGNEEYIQKNHLGAVFPDIPGMVKAIPSYTTFKEKIKQAPKNRALEEVADFIHKQLKTDPAFIENHDKTLLAIRSEQS